MLSVLSEFIPQIPAVSVDGIFGTQTREAVLAAQRLFGLTEDGIVGELTWDEIYDQYSGIENTTLRSGETFPTSTGTGAARNRYAQTSTLEQYPGTQLRMGSSDPVRQEVVR